MGTPIRLLPKNTTPSLEDEIAEAAVGGGTYRISLEQLASLVADVVVSLIETDGAGFTVREETGATVHPITIIEIGGGLTLGDPSPGIARINLDKHDAANHQGNLFPGDSDQDLGAHAIQISEIGAPATPTAGKQTIFLSSSSHELSVKNSAGVVTSLVSAVGVHDLAAHTGNIMPLDETQFLGQGGVRFSPSSIISTPSGLDKTLFNNAGTLSVIAFGGGVFPLAYIKDHPSVKLTNETVSSSATLQDDDDLFGDVTSGHVYAVYVLGFVDNSGDRGIKAGFGGTATVSLLRANARLYSVTNLGDIAAETLSSLGATIAGGSGAASPDLELEIKGTVVASSTGVFKFRWAQESASGSTVLKAGSRMLLTDITP